MEETKREESGKEKKVGKGQGAARDLCYIALFAAIIAVCAWISVPVGDIPVTLQTMGVCLAAAFLGLKRGTAAVAVYILLGLCGVPVFAGFTGGAAKLLMPTGGYIVGFIFTALVVGGVSDAVGERIKSAWAEDDFRSVNGQIEYLLSECVRQRKKNGKYVSDQIDVPPELDV